MIDTITIGGDLVVQRLGLGTNRIKHDEASINFLREAATLGIDFIDTADYYTNRDSERAIGDALAPYAKPHVTIATKGGMVPGERGVWNGSPEYLRAAVEGSLERLKLERIELYQLHRVDPKVPLADSVECLKEMRDAGKIRHIGLSEVSVAQLEEARSIVEIATVQNEYNLEVRKYDDVVEYCERESIVFLPFFPLGHGRIDLQREEITSIAKHHTITVQQVALAWLLHRSQVMLPIPGTLSVEHLCENLAAAEVALTSEEVATLTALVP